MVDHNIRRLVESRPLLKFSLYTSGQVDTLRRIGFEIVDLSKAWENLIASDQFQRVYDLFWLWVLGAYEVTWTMDQNGKACFSEQLQAKIKDMKTYLAKIRVPFAKQEMRGTADPMYGELSVIDVRKGISFQIGPERYASSDVIRRFLEFADGIRLDDVLAGVPARGL